MKDKKLLDSFALIKFFNEEPGFHSIEDLLTQARKGNLTLYLTEINAGEIYYIVAKRNSPDKADEILKLMRILPIEWLPCTWEQILATARLKAQYPLSYADCFAVTAAIEHQAELVTGDPEFEAVASLVKIRWV